MNSLQLFDNAHIINGCMIVYLKAKCGKDVTYLSSFVTCLGIMDVSLHLEIILSDQNTMLLWTESVIRNRIIKEVD